MRFNRPRKELLFQDCIALAAIVLCACAMLSGSTFAALDDTNLKHIFVVLYGLVGVYRLVGKHKKFMYGRELIYILICAAVLLAISFIFMILNGYSNAWLTELYFLIVPAWFIFCYLGEDNSKERFDMAMNTMFYSISIIYVVTKLPNLNMASIKQISFVESRSPFEFGGAQIFAIMYMYYTYRNLKWKKRISCILAIFSWKRMALVFVILFTILQFFVRKSKPISIKYRVIMTIAFCMVPACMEIILTKDFSEWFYKAFTIDLKSFMMSRHELLSYAMNADEPSHGLGTFFSIKIPWYGGYLEQSMHNDIIRLYLEVSIVGLAVFIWCYSSLVKDIFAGVVIFYVFVELASAHFLGNGSMPYWITILLCVYYMNTYERENKKHFNVHIRGDG